MLYKKMYLILFRAITKALRALDDGRREAARQILVRAQQDSEECYISGETESKSIVN